MKQYLLGFLVLTACPAFAQPKVVSQVIINTTTNVIAPEEDDTQNPGGGMNFRNMMDGETKSTTWLKNDLVKTILKSDMGRSTIYRNNATKITTIFLEVMGNKFGFFVSDSEQVDMKRKADSMVLSRRKHDSTTTEVAKAAEQPVEISYAGDTKKIIGYECKKAYIISTRLLGTKDTVTAWYNAELKLEHLPATGGLSGISSMSTIKGLDKLDGFVMRYEMNMPRGRKMEVEVTRIDTSKEIADKEFEIPKDVEIKPIKEMQGLFGGRGGFGMQRSN